MAAKDALEVIAVKVSCGSIKIQKSSEDSKVSGISFTISGNGFAFLFAMVTYPF